MSTHSKSKYGINIHIAGGAETVLFNTTDKDIPALRLFSERPPLERFIETAREVLKDEKLARKAGIYLCHKYSGAPLKEIAAKFDIGVKAVGEASKLFMRKLDKDKSLWKFKEVAINNIKKCNIQNPFPKKSCYFKDFWLQFAQFRDDVFH